MSNTNQKSTSNQPYPIINISPKQDSSEQDDPQQADYTTAELQDNLAKLSLGLENDITEQQNPYTNENIHFSDENNQQFMGIPYYKNTYDTLRTDASINDMIKPQDALFNHSQQQQLSGNMTQFLKKDMEHIQQTFSMQNTNQGSQGNNNNKKQSPLYPFYGTDRPPLHGSTNINNNPQNNMNTKEEYNPVGESTNFIKKSSMEIGNKDEIRRKNPEMSNPFNFRFSHPQQGNEEFNLNQNLIKQNFFNQSQPQGQDAQEPNNPSNFYTSNSVIQSTTSYNNNLNNKQNKGDFYNFVMWDNNHFDNPNDDEDNDDEDNNNGDEDNNNNTNKNKYFKGHDHNDINNDNNTNEDDDNDNANQNNNLNENNVDQNNDVRSINSDDYTFEKFGKKGWMCAGCSNFNFQSKYYAYIYNQSIDRKECNRCHIPKQPKLLNKNNMHNQPLFANPFRTAHGGNITNNTNNTNNTSNKYSNNNQSAMPGGFMGGMNMNPQMGMGGQEVKQRKPFKEREGDWHCLQCQNLNFSFRQVCNRCSAPKPPTAGSNNPTKHNNPNNNQFMNNYMNTMPMAMNFGLSPGSKAAYLQSSSPQSQYSFQTQPILMQNFPQQDNSPFNNNQMNLMNNYYSMINQQQNMLYQQNLLNYKANTGAGVSNDDLYKKK